MGFQRGAGGSSLEPVWGRGRGTCLKSAPCRTVASWLLLEACVPLPPTGRPSLLRPRSPPGSRRRRAGTAPGGGAASPARRWESGEPRVGGTDLASGLLRPAGPSSSCGSPGQALDLFAQPTRLENSQLPPPPALRVFPSVFLSIPRPSLRWRISCFC